MPSPSLLWECIKSVPSEKAGRGVVFMTSSSPAEESIASERRNSLIRTLRPTSTIRAVAVVLGHLGVTEEQLVQYGQALYCSKSCAAITAAAPVGRFACNASLRPTALAVLHDTAVVLRDAPGNVPLVIHVFSNGGAFILEEMQVLLEQRKDDASNVEGVDLELIARCLELGYQCFDSCPCFVRPFWNWTGMTRAFPHPAWSVPGRTIYAVGASCALTVWCAVTFALNRPMQFWRRMQQSRICPHQVYIYTTTDMASDAHQVDALIQYRRELIAESDITMVYRYDDSDHCRLLRDHPTEYHAAVDQALEAAIRRSNGRKEQLRVT